MMETSTRQRRQAPVLGIRRCLLAALLVAATAMACTSAKQLAMLPGLPDLRATSPAGKACYQRCAMVKMDCNHMCPGEGSDCKDECVRSSKLCLANCPDLVRIHPEAK